MGGTVPVFPTGPQDEEPYMVSQECEEGEVNMSEGNGAREWSLVPGNPFIDNPSNLIPHWGGGGGGILLTDIGMLSQESSKSDVSK